MPETIKMRDQEEQKRYQHIQKMKETLRQRFGEFEIELFGNFKTLKMEELFLEQILLTEGVEEKPLFDLLEKRGFRLPPADQLDDAQLHAKLWELINEMAVLHCYLSSTDHLSDRQLYEVLWTDMLREPAPVTPLDREVCNIDILGGCSEEDLQLRLKYYADEFERLAWADEFPDDVIPPHEDLPYDRDRLLPGPPYPTLDRRRNSLPQDGK